MAVSTPGDGTVLETGAQGAARPVRATAIAAGRARWTLAETLTGAAGTLLTTILVARIVGPAAVGLAALAAAVVSLAQPLVGHAFTNGLVQRPRLEQADVASALWAAFGLALLLAAGLAALGLLLPGIFAPGVAPLLAALALLLPAQAVEGAANGVLLRRQDARALALRGIFAQVAGFATGVGLALGGAGAWALVGQQLAFFGVAAALAALFAGLPLRPAWRTGTLRALAPYAAATVAGGLAQRAGPRLFLLLVAGSAPALAGVLQLCFRISEQARDLPAPFVHRFALPTLSRLAADRAAFLRRLDALCILSGLGFAPLFAGLALCAAEVQALLLGPAWAGVAPPLAVLSATLALLAPRLPLWPAFVAAAMPGASLRLTALSFVLTLALAVPVAGGGALEAAGAWASALLLSALAAAFVAARRLRFGLWRQARGWAFSLLPAGAVAAAVLGAEAAGLVPGWVAGALAAKVAIGAAAGLPLIALLGRRPWREAAAPVPGAH